jgi:hypothetical protein
MRMQSHKEQSTSNTTTKSNVTATRIWNPHGTRLKGSVLILQAAFADINIGKDRPVYSTFGRIGHQASNELGSSSLRGDDAMDTDLDQMTREQLIAEVKKLRQGIREHRDTSCHDLCWHHPSLWGLLPEKTDPLPVVPEWPEFMRMRQVQAVA